MSIIGNPFEKDSPNNENLGDNPFVGDAQGVGMPRSAPSHDVNGFDDYFDEDEETLALNAAKTNKSLQQVYGSDSDPTARLLDESFRSLKAKYPAGGLKASRFITADILLTAPADYFNRFDADVDKAVKWVQAALASTEKSNALGDAVLAPTDDALQEQAFRVVQNFTIEYMDKMNYRGVEKEIVKSMVANEIIGFGRLDPLWRDRKIDEILCNGPHDIQVEIQGQLYKVPSCQFRDEAHIMSLIERLYGAIGKQVSRTTPLVKGRLHDNSRMFAVHSSIAPTGPNFSIRRHPEKFWTPADIVKRGSADADLMTFLGNLIYKGCSFIVIGATSTGKTSMLNALTGFYRPDVRILTLEDNLEMKPNPNKLLAAAMECKPPATDRPNDKGVTMRDLVKGTLQLRPDGLIIGEVTDAAAYDLCQALNTGHFGASTIHANSEFDGIYRIASLVAQSELVSSEGALPLISAAFDFIIQLDHFPVDGSRRIVSVSEVAPYPEVSDSGRVTLPVHQLWKYAQDGMHEGKVVGHYEQVSQMSAIRTERRRLNMERDLTWEELQILSKI